MNAHVGLSCRLPESEYHTHRYCVIWHNMEALGNVLIGFPNVIDKDK